MDGLLHQSPSLHTAMYVTSHSNALLHVYLSLIDELLYIKCIDLLFLKPVCLHADYGETQVKAALGIFLVSTLMALTSVMCHVFVLLAFFTY